jgi:hypothetical protein
LILNGLNTVSFKETGFTPEELKIPERDLQLSKLFIGGPSYKKIGTPVRSSY